MLDNLPFEIPENWYWCRLPDIGHSELGKTLNKDKNIGKPYKYLCSINIYWERIDLSKIKTALFEENEIDKYTVLKGDLLMCEGGDVGRCAIWDKDETILYQNALHRIRFYENISPDYFLLVFECYKAIKIIDSVSKGVTIKHLVQSSLNSLYLPLPPRNEQYRIMQYYKQIQNLIKGES